MNKINSNKKIIILLLVMSATLILTGCNKHGQINDIIDDDISSGEIPTDDTPSLHPNKDIPLETDPTDDISPTDIASENNPNLQLEYNKDDLDTYNDITTPIIVQEVLIGGLNKGQWMYHDNFYNSGAVDFEGFEYDVYSDNTKIATAIGKQPSNWMSGDILEGPEYEYDYCIVHLYENDTIINSFDIALKADWDLYPRLYYEDISEDNYYEDIVNNYLIEVGLENPETTIKQSIKVDLDGDGVEEIIIAANNKIEDTFEETKKGDNAVVIFRKFVDGQAIDQLLDYYILIDEPEYSSPYRLLYNVESIADLDGDGILEIITRNWYYEGFGWSIYKLIDNKLELVASNGIGA